MGSSTIHRLLCSDQRMREGRAGIRPCRSWRRQQQGLQPDLYTYGAVISACRIVVAQRGHYSFILWRCSRRAPAQCDQLPKGLAALYRDPPEWIPAQFYRPKAAISSCGKGVLAKRPSGPGGLQQKGLQPDLVTVNAASCMWNNGDTERALQLFVEMQQKGSRPM